MYAPVVVDRPLLVAGVEHHLQLAHYPLFLLHTVFDLLEQPAEVLLDGLEEYLCDDEHSFHVPAGLDQNKGLALPVVALLAHPEGLLQRVVDLVDELLHFLSFLTQHDLQVPQQ